MGRLAKIAASLLAEEDLKARLWDISCIARKRFWFAVAPTRYAVRRNRSDSTEWFRSKVAASTCMLTTARTRYFVSGSGPQSLVT